MRPFIRIKCRCVEGLCVNYLDMMDAQAEVHTVGQATGGGSGGYLGCDDSRPDI
jgi:hypothetical protein